MSEDEEPADAPDDAEEEVSFDDRLDVAVTAVSAAEDNGEDALSDALESVTAAIAAAGTEADLDAVGEVIDDIDALIADTEFPEPDDEDADPPGEVLEGQLDDARTALDEARGPYASDVISSVEAAITTIEDTRWTDDGEEEIVDSVAGFVATVNETLDTDLDAATTPDSVPDSLQAAIDAIETESLDPDTDTAAIAALIDAADELTTGLEEAEAWDDLTTREQLQAEGFYEVLGHRKDYPPEWSALKEHEKRGNVDMILLALDKLGMEFMEEHCLAALKRMGHEAALEPMLERAERRDRAAIEILGKIGSDEPVDTIVEYVETDSDPLLQKTTLKALGEIGAERATGPIAEKLVADNEIIRSHAARALGLIGDPRAVDPLADVLATDGSATVRGSAAWALNQIGTQRALEVIAEHVDDRTYLVQAEAEKAAEAL